VGEPRARRGHGGTALSQDGAGPKDGAEAQRSPMAGKSGGADPGPKTRTFRLPTGVEWTIFALCALLGLGAAMLVRAPGPVGDVLWRLELTTYDWRLRLRAVEPRSKDIVIVGVDNTSLQMVGSWPWPREYHAELVDALHRAGARVVMFDMLFDLPSSRGPFVNGISRDDLAFADACVELGLHISFAGAVTYTNKKFDSLRAVAAGVPGDRMLVETDCPYQTPHPLRNKQPRNEPALVVHTARRLAEIRGLTLDALAALTAANARRVFRLP